MSWIFLIPLTLAQLIIIWLESDALIEYVKLFRLNKIIPHFGEYLRNGKGLNYKEYLRKNYDSFFVRLITCSICLSTFLSGLSTLFLAIAVQSIGIMLLWFPIAYCSLMLYELFRKLTK